MEISKIIFLLIFGGVLIMVSAPILWSDADERIDLVTVLILGQAVIGLLIVIAGSFIYLLK